MADQPPHAAPPPSAAAPHRERRWLPALAVLLIIVGLVGGGYAAAVAVQPPPQPPVDVAPGVRVAPAEGWVVADRFRDPPGVRLTTGSATLDVFAPAFPGSAAELFDAYVEQVLDPAAEQLSVGDPQEVVLASGLVAVRGGYVGVFSGVAAPVEGEVTAVVGSGGTTVVFDGWAGQGLLAQAVDEMREMIDGAEVA